MIPAAQFRQGVEEFNRREFYETHETLEEIWLKAAEPEKTFLQGIIQVACALHHYVRGNRAGAESLMRRGLDKLDQFPANYGEIKLQPLREKVRWWLEEIIAGRNPGRERLPRIKFNEGREEKTRRTRAGAPRGGKTGSPREWRD